MFVMKKSILIALAVLVLAACSNSKSNEEPEKKGSSGKTLELLIVANQDVYCGDTKALTDSLFKRPQPCLLEPQSLFDVVNIPLSSFQNTEMFQVHRNVLIFDVRPGNPDKVYLHRDQYAAPQVIFDFAASSPAKLQELLRRYEQSILDNLYDAEHRRIIKAFRGINNYDLNEQVRKKFGFGLQFSNEFAWAKSEDDFAWIRKEAKDFGIGVLVDVQPYVRRDQFDEQHILDRLDTVMKRHVPASAEGSYAGIERRRDSEGYYLAPIQLKAVDFPNSTYCVETRGNWRSFGDIMGGPFVCYTLLSPDNKQVVTLMGYVYCPRNKPWTKRDLLMQLESICYSIDY